MNLQALMYEQANKGSDYMEYKHSILVKIDGHPIGHIWAYYYIQLSLMLVMEEDGEADHIIITGDSAIIGTESYLLKRISFYIDD